MKPMQSSCDEYQCPCHARVKELEASLKREQVTISDLIKLKNELVPENFELQDRVKELEQRNEALLAVVRAARVIEADINPMSTSYVVGMGDLRAALIEAKKLGVEL